MNKNDSKGTFWQVIATIVIWTMMTIGIALGSIFLAPNLGEDVLGFFVLLLIATVLSTGFVWDWGQVAGQESRRNQRDRQKSKQKNEAYEGDYYDNEYEAKVKHDRLSAALKSLSDEELIRLRGQIARGEVREEQLSSLLDDHR